MATSNQSSTVPKPPAPAIPIVILNGFLGAGKTTLLRHLLSQCSRANKPIGVIVNEMSTLDIDGHIIAETDFFADNDPRFVSISSEVLSSTQGIALLDQALTQITQPNPPELVIIETSGSCHPLPLIDYFQGQTTFQLHGVLVMADSFMLQQDFNHGKDLLPRLQHNLMHGSRDMVNLFVEQIMFCSHLLLSKTDKLAEGTLQELAQRVHELNPYVAITAVPWGRYDLNDMLALPPYDFQRVQQLGEEIRPSLQEQTPDQPPYNLTSQVIRDDRPFHPQRLWDTCQQFLGNQIYRSKGFFWLASRDAESLLWNQAAGSISLELVGSWRAGILADPNNNLDDYERAQLQEQVAQASGNFGDRHCHLTIIGDESQVATFTHALRNCFLTDQEIKSWQAGEELSDPWPATLKAI